jgi:hypothetical protein
MDVYRTFIQRLRRFVGTVFWLYDWLFRSGNKLAWVRHSFPHPPSTVQKSAHTLNVGNPAFGFCGFTSTLVSPACLSFFCFPSPTAQPFSQGAPVSCVDRDKLKFLPKRNSSTQRSGSSSLLTPCAQSVSYFMSGGIRRTDAITQRCSSTSHYARQR